MDVLACIERCDDSYQYFRTRFALLDIILNDIESMRRQDEQDLPKIEEYFSEILKEALLRRGKFDSEEISKGGPRAPYLGQLREQHKAGRWLNDSSIHRDTAKALDPRYARFLSLMYTSGDNTMLGKSWISLVKSYEQIAISEISNRAHVEPISRADQFTIGDVESYGLRFFGERGWSCKIHPDRFGNLLVLDRPFNENLVLRCTITFGGAKIAPQIEAWLSITPPGSARASVTGGGDALTSLSIRDFIQPAGRYYFLHDENYFRILNGLETINIILSHLTNEWAFI